MYTAEINEIDEEEGCDLEESDDEGLENLGVADDDEVSLGNFYTDLEKQPLYNKQYSTSSENRDKGKGGILTKSNQEDYKATASSQKSVTAESVPYGTKKMEIS